MSGTQWGMKGRSDMAEGQSGTAATACSAGVRDDLTSGALLSLQAEQAVLLHVSAISLPSPMSLYLPCVSPPCFLFDHSVYRDVSNSEQERNEMNGNLNGRPPVSLYRPCL